MVLQLSASSPRTQVFWAAFVFLISMSVYLVTLAPTVVFVDSGELIVAANSLGVAHPPGFPLYVLLAHLATRVPLSNVAVRVNFASALFAAVAIAFLFLLVAQVLNAPLFQIDKRKRKNARSKKKENVLGPEQPRPINSPVINQLLPAAVASLMLAFSRTLWSFATVAEVYTLNTLMVAVIFFLIFRWRKLQVTRKQGGGVIGRRGELEPRTEQNFRTARDGLVYLAALVFGLALGVHHVTVAVTLPAVAMLVYRTSGFQFFKSKRLLYCALISLGGLCLVYMYLPLAASRSPLMNWGDASTLERIWWHVSGRQYQVFILFSVQQIANGVVEFLKLTAHEFGPIWCPVALVLAALGLFAMFRQNRTTFWFVAVVIGCDLAYALNYEIAEDKGAYYLPTFIATAIAAGFGAQWFLRFLARKRKRLLLAGGIAALLLVPLAGFAGNFSFNNRHNFFLARDYVNNIENTIAPGGMLLTSDWQVYSPLLYLHEVEHQRQDVVAIDISLLRRSWYYDYLRKQYPRLIAETSDKVEMFLADLRSWEKSPDTFKARPDLTRQINDHFYEMILAFVSTQMQKAPVYVTWELGLGFVEDDIELTESLNKEYQLVPQGLVFQLSRNRGFQMPADAQLETRGLNDKTFSFDPGDVVMLKVFPVYVNMLINRGRYLAAYGKYDEAFSSYRKALDLAPNDRNALDAWADTLRMMRGSIDETR